MIPVEARSRRSQRGDISAWRQPRLDQRDERRGEQRADVLRLWRGVDDERHKTIKLPSSYTCLTASPFRDILTSTEYETFGAG